MPRPGALEPHAVRRGGAGPRRRHTPGPGADVRDIAELVRAGGPRGAGAVMARWGGGVPWWRVVRADGSPAPGHEDSGARAAPRGRHAAAQGRHQGRPGCGPLGRRLGVRLSEGRGAARDAAEVSDRRDGIVGMSSSPPGPPDAGDRPAYRLVRADTGVLRAPCSTRRSRRWRPTAAATARARRSWDGQDHDVGGVRGSAGARGRRP
jgi:hypothetical protein